METNKIQWRRISEGEELPCDSLLMRYDGTITRGTCAGVKAGQDAYYLPFDELKKLPKEESEDERIRKELIGYFTGWSDKRLFRGFKAEQMLAWLERQGEHKKFLDSIQVGDKVTRNEDGVLVNLSQLNRVAKKDEKQGGQRTKLVDFDLNAKDSDLQEETYFIPKGFHAEIIGDKVVIKKGEQKPVPDWMPKFLDELRSKKNYFDWDEHKDIEGGILAIINWMNPNYFNEKDGKQKPIDKVEPMFKKGDWLVNIEYGNIVRVFDVLEDNYKLEYDGDTIGGLCIEVIDKDYRLWTIQDAKDGDMLVCDINQRPFIFKGLLDPYHPNCPVAYCGIDIEGNCYVSKHNNWWTDCNVRPATKEQRDALKKAMADAGYTFDFEKKELCKIEQKPAENEELTEFDKAVGVSIGTWNPKTPEQIQSVKAVSKKLLKLAKKQINDEQKPWSEDDSYMQKQAIRCVNNSGKLEVSTEEIEDWLKSLKDRVGCEANCTTTKECKPDDLPHWKKSTLPDDNTTGFNSDFFCHRGYHINYKELFEKLPKDD